jgi:outer membrane murein-binding lipoprotein Lpp
MSTEETEFAIQTLQARVDNLVSELQEAYARIDRLERDVSYLEHNKIAQVERDVYSLESDVRNHEHR